MEVTPRVGSDDWNLYGEAEVDLFVRARMPTARLSFSLSHSPLEGDALTARWPTARLYAFLRSRYCLWCYARSGGASVRHTHSSELADQPWFPDLTEMLIAPPLADSGQEGHVISRWTARCGTRTQNYGTSCVVASGLSGELDALAGSVWSHTHGSASTLYKTIVCLKNGSVCELVPSGSHRPGVFAPCWMFWVSCSTAG